MSTAKTAGQIEKNSAEYWEERVPVFIEETENSGELPVNVSVNGECITVARGVEVMVKRKFKEVIDNAKKSMRESKAFIKSNAKKSAV